MTNKGKFLDERFQENIWETTIPIKFQIDQHDLTTANQPLALYVCVPRVAYIASYFNDIMDNLKGIVETELKEIWLELEGVPIKWNYPIGPILDSIGINLENGPVSLTVHIKELDAKKVIRFYNTGDLVFHYKNALKAGTQISYKVGKPALGVLPENTQRINLLPLCNDFKMLGEYRKIMNEVDAKGLEQNNQKVDRYPVRLVLCNGDSILTRGVRIDTENEEKYTMKNFFQEIFDEVYDEIKQKCNIIIHGMPIEEDMNFLYYYYNFQYVDTFLYISFNEKKEPVKE